MTYTSVTFNAQVNNKTDTYNITKPLSSAVDKKIGGPIIAATNQDGLEFTKYLFTTNILFNLKPIAGVPHSRTIAIL